MTVPIATIALLANAVQIHQPERIAFTCSAGDQVATVVRSGQDLAYRSKHGGAIELQIVGGGVSRMGYSGGGELQVVFRSGPWTYVVYQRTVRTSFSGRNNPACEAGVDVLRGGRVVNRRRCDDATDEFDEDALAGLPEGWFTEH